MLILLFRRYAPPITRMITFCQSKITDLLLNAYIKAYNPQYQYNKIFNILL